MPRGTVKDPTGHQSGPYDFGYIQRIPENFSQLEDLAWPGSTQSRVIPFLNKDKAKGPAVGTIVNFQSVQAEVYLDGECLGTIGIAVNVVPG